MKKILYVFAFFILVGAGCSSVAPEQDSVVNDKKVGGEYSAIFDLGFKDYDGNEVSIKDHIGTPLIINSWAAWCPFCREELKDFAIVQKELGDKVKFIAIDRRESLDVAKGYTGEIGVTNDLIFWLDSGDSFYKGIGGFSMPETIFVDAEGNVTLHKRGVMRIDEIRERIDNII